MEKFKMPSWSARNPLGIIALFISLIYGMSALLLGASVGSLEKYNETILVVFVVVFPVLVLSVFGWLVGWHHKKLYGPGDYRSDQGFLEASTAGNPSSIGERLGREIEAEVSEPTPDNDQISLDLPETESLSSRAESRGESRDSQADVATDRVKDRQNVMLRRYVAESLVFQELQDEYAGLIRREVTLRSASGQRLRVDGVVQTEQGIVAVEVRMAPDGRMVNFLLRRMPDLFVRYSRAFRNEGFDNVEFLLVVVIDGSVDEVIIAEKHVERYRKDTGNMISVRLRRYDDLLNKFGFPTAAGDEDVAKSLMLS